MRDYNELDLIQIELKRLEVYNRHLQEYQDKVDAFCERNNLDSMLDFYTDPVKRSDEVKREYYQILDSNPKQSKAYVKRILIRIRELSLEYEAKL